MSEPSRINAVIMGRKTWESIPEQHRPLAGRFNVVVSRSLKQVPEGVVLAVSLGEALKAATAASAERIFIVGGGEIYREALALCDDVFLTQVDAAIEGCDTFFPELPAGEFDGPWAFGLPAAEDKGIKYRFTMYQRKAHTGRKRAAAPEATSAVHEEYQYLDLVREILNHGVVKGDRTGTGTKSVFGRSMRFSLRDGAMPLLTTKRTFWRGLALELLWFISGNTSAKTLQEQNVTIWDGNSSRAYLDSIGLHAREEGDLGPVYGFQWRHFGAQYGTMYDDYGGKGVDQLADVVHQIKNSPNSRRILMTAWNPSVLKEMALPPCHLLSQFYVANGELSCQMYQRSADMGLGVPFNIASYALLTHMLAKVCGLRAGEFVHVLGDAHVYLNHEEALREQLAREPRPFPRIVFKRDVQSIDDFKFEDFDLVDYNPHKAIKMDMAV